MAENKTDSNVLTSAARNSSSSSDSSTDVPVGPYPEDKLNTLMNKCWTDAIIKSGVGFGIGFLCSVLFVRRFWPPLLGASFGLGVAYKECERNLLSLTECEPIFEVKGKRIL
uniref:MICOS complex subunit MIC10 n=1 Tax=Ceratitis capitata TaxID=7213 RepID=W8CAS9_CERCA